MTYYSIEPRDCIFLKGYGFLTFAKNIGKIIRKNVVQNLSNKYSQKPLDDTKHFAEDALQKTANQLVI